MAPLSMAAVLLLPAAVAWWVTRRRPAGVTDAWVAAVIVATGAYELGLLLGPRVHPAALAILSIGVGWRSAALLQRWPQLLSRGPRWVALGMAIGVAVTVAATSFRAHRATRDGLAAAAGVASDAVPNVILLILDTVRASELSGLGYPRSTTPVLDSLAAEGISFTHAVSTAPWTLPSHATLFTGRYPHELSTGWTKPLDETHSTLAEVLRERGWATGAFSANLYYVGEEYGLGRGFSTFRSYARSVSQLLGTTMIGRQIGHYTSDRLGLNWHRGRKSTARVVDEFLGWRRSVGAKRYFAFLNVYDAHEPYAPPAPYDLMFSTREPPLRRIEPSILYTGDTLAGLREAYDGALAWTDAQLRRLLDGLRVSGDLERTLIVITSDHGEEFAEHGHVSHGNGLHFPSLHVPLIVLDPRRPPTARISVPVTLRDVPSTILARAGGLDPRIPGRPLSVHWDPDAESSFEDHELSPVLSLVDRVLNQPARYPASRGDLRSIVLDGYHLIEGPGEGEEIYHLADDPLEQRNLVNDPGVAEVLTRAREALKRSTVPP